MSDRAYIFVYEDGQGSSIQDDLPRPMEVHDELVPFVNLSEFLGRKAEQTTEEHNSASFESPAGPGSSRKGQKTAETQQLKRRRVKGRNNSLQRLRTNVFILLLNSSNVLRCRKHNRLLRLNIVFIVKI